MAYEIDKVETQEDEGYRVQFVVQEMDGFNEVMRISFSGGRMTVTVAPHITMDDAAKAFLDAVSRAKLN